MASAPIAAAHDGLETDFAYDLVFAPWYSQFDRQLRDLNGFVPDDGSDAPWRASSLGTPPA